MGVIYLRISYEFEGFTEILLSTDMELNSVFQMVTAIVLLQVERDLINEVAEQIIEIKGVSEVYSVAGRFDLVTMIRVKDNEGLAEVVTNHMLKVKGIKNSETLIAFRVFSKYDLERMFSIGMEEKIH
jgi:DNA-binding Lrp family transcriptional regulator